MTSAHSAADRVIDPLVLGDAIIQHRDRTATHFCGGASCASSIAASYERLRQSVAPLPIVNADVLGRAIAEHRQAEFDPITHVAGSHLCFDDCAEDIYARCLRLIAK